MNYYEVIFHLEPVLPAREIVIAELAERGFESFVESENGLLAYISEKEYSDDLLQDLMLAQMEDLQWSFSKKLIPDENWNAEWEKNFDPIVVSDQCVVRAPFHPIPNVEFDVVIEPKMSFGTGHHHTTRLMMQEILELHLQGKKLLDMGSGTGVLAILAEMKGAKQIDAVDIDEWAYENAKENVHRNACTKIHCEMGGAELLNGRMYDIVLANINRNILMRDAGVYGQCLHQGGQLLLSGFYAMDIPQIQVAFSMFRIIAQRQSEEWVMLRMEKV